MDKVFRAEYGVHGHLYKDVTELVLSKLYRNGTIFLPSTDVERAQILGDPFPGVVKEILLTIEENGQVKQLRYPSGILCILDVPQLAVNRKLDCYELNQITSPKDRLEAIHKSLILFGGNFKDEYPEQLLAAEFIRPNAKVLELGANIGRNTLVIASLLNDDRNLVSLECNADTANILECNRNNNKLRFQIEPSAISEHKLYISGWNAYNETNKPPGATEVKTITWPDLLDKYRINFDTLVVDCEGSLYEILKSYPKILYNINLVIVENDYLDYEQKLYVDSIFREFGLELVRSDPGPPFMVCAHNFYEVWMKIH